MTKRNILVGWKATGPYPTTVSRPLLLMLLASADKTLHETPQMRTEKQEDLLKTPRRTSNIYQLIK